MISAISSLGKGATYHAKAFRLFASKPRYWRFAAIPIALNLLLYIAFGFLFFYFGLPWVGKLVPATTAGEGIMAYIWPVLRFLLEALVTLIVLAAFLLTFTAVFFVLASPFVDMLSVKIEKDLYHFEFKDGDYWQFAKDIWMSMKNSVWMTLLSLFWTVVFLPLNFFIPVVGFIPGLVAASYFLGLSFLIYSIEHRRVKRKDFKKLFRHNRMKILGFGLVAYGILLIPFSGIVFLPVAVAAGTMLFNENMDWEALTTSEGSSQKEKSPGKREENALQA